MVGLHSSGFNHRCNGLRCTLCAILSVARFVGAIDEFTCSHCSHSDQQSKCQSLTNFRDLGF